MSLNKSKRRGTKKMLVTAATVIGASAFLFQGVLAASTETEFQKGRTVETIYLNEVSTDQAVQHIPEGYEKADYIVGDIDLEYYKDQQPTSKDIVKEEAAEIGAQALWELFNISLDGQVIEMGYDEAIEGLPRPSWNGDIMIDGELTYSFSVDAVTGELFYFSYTRTLDETVSVAFDPKLEQQGEEFLMKAKELAEKHGIVDDVQIVLYQGQGYSNNDPDISVEIFGENGEIALMTLSRHDKALKGVVYDVKYKYDLEYNEKIEQELIENMENGIYDEVDLAVEIIEENGEPVLKVLSEDEIEIVEKNGKPVPQVLSED